MTKFNAFDNTLESKTLLRDALDKLERSRKKIIVVLDTNDKVVGTLTDGDIRRALLSGVKLDDPVSKAMNPKPVVALEGEDLSVYTKDIKNNIFKHIVIVSKNRILLNIISQEDLNPSLNRGKIAVIMAGGRGKRLGAITDDIPKPMLEIAGKPMIEIVINRLHAHGYTKLYISVLYKKEVIKNYLKDGKDFDVEIEYIEEDAPLGTAGSLSLLPQSIAQDFLVTNADLVTNVDFFALENSHLTSNKLATVCMKNYEVQIPFGVVELDAKLNVTGIVEKPISSYFISSGIYLFKPEVLKQVPKGEYLDMPDFLRILMEKNSINAFPVFEVWHDVGRVEDLMLVRDKFGVQK